MPTSRAWPLTTMLLAFALTASLFFAHAQPADPSKPPEAQPVPKVERGRGNVNTGLHDNLSPEEWVRRRNKQIEARG